MSSLSTLTLIETEKDKCFFTNQTFLPFGLRQKIFSRSDSRIHEDSAETDTPKSPLHRPVHLEQIFKGPQSLLSETYRRDGIY